MTVKARLPNPDPLHLPCLTARCTNTVTIKSPRLFDDDGKWITQPDGGHAGHSRRYCEECRSGATGRAREESRGL